MKKKGLSNSTVVVINVLLVLLALGVVFFVIKGIVESKQEFKIYKEGCELKEPSGITLGVGDQLILVTNNTKKIINEKNVLNITKIDNGVIFIDIYVCGKVEVDEIEFQVEKVNMTILQKSDYAVTDEESKRIYYNLTSIISKQDLTFEWLDENCDCVWFDDNGCARIEYKRGEYIIKVLR